MSTPIDELRRRFYIVERDNQFDKIKIRGLPIWDILRFPVFNQLIAHLRIIDLNTEGNYIGKKTRSTFFLGAIFNLRRNPLLGRKADLLFLGGGRRKYIDGEWINLYCDPIIDDISYSYNYIEKQYNYSHFKPIRTKHRYNMDYIDFKAKLLRKIRRRKFAFLPEEQKVIDNLTSIFNDEFSVQLDLLSFMTDYLIVHDVYIKYYKKILGKMKPKLVILEQSYGKELFIKACQDYNVPTVELQHGIIEGVPYSYEYIGKTLFPDFLFTFGEYWNSAVKFPIPESNISTIGYPFFDRLKKKYSNRQKEDIFLVISQPPISVKLSQFISELAEIIPEEFNIRYKLHPNETKTWSQNYPHLVKENVEVIYDDKADLYELFATSRYLIGVYSTAIYEGLGFGLLTFIPTITGFEVMKHLEGKVTFVNAPEEILKELRQPKKELNFQQFFANYKAEKLNKVISLIIAKS